VPCVASEIATENCDRSQRDDRSLRLEALVGLALFISAFWMLQHRYAGLINDGSLYALGVLARLHPDSLGLDIFLGPGSQNHYTLFSPLAAVLAASIGIERAAAWITFVSQIAFFAAGAWLARRLMPPTYALLAAAMLVMLPDGYGAHHIFSACEPVMTARLPADALVLAAVALALSGRYVVCTICMVAAGLLHPLMATGGGVLLLVLWVGLRRPWTTFWLAVIALTVLWLATSMTPHGPISQADRTWFDLLRSRLSYAFPSRWLTADWGQALVPLATLAVGSVVIERARVRALCRAALVTGLAGLSLALLGSDLLHIVLIMQGQPWRWLWIANTLVLLLIPVIAHDCLRAGPASRSALLLLAAGWIGIDTAPVAALAVIAVPVVALKNRLTTPARIRLVRLSATLLLALSLVQFTASLLNDLRGAAALLPAHNPGLDVDELDAWVRGGILPAALFASLWCITTRWGSLASSACALVAGVALCVGFTPLAWHAWTDPAPWEAWHDRFAAWRREIPHDAQVLAADVPNIPWFVLERPSYWSLRQMAGMVFSRQIAMELLVREKRVQGYLTRRHPLHNLTSLCTANPSLAYFISPTNLGETRFAAIDIGPEAIAGSRLRLYRCGDYRH
jgi:hypothetical protein